MPPNNSPLRERFEKRLNKILQGDLEEARIKQILALMKDEASKQYAQGQTDALEYRFPPVPDDAIKNHANQSLRDRFEKAFFIRESLDTKSGFKISCDVEYAFQFLSQEILLALTNRENELRMEVEATKNYAKKYPTMNDDRTKAVDWNNGYQAGLSAVLALLTEKK